MLKSIYIVTVIVASINAAEGPYGELLGYHPAHFGTVSQSEARHWGAPATAGRPFVTLQPASQRAVYLRLIEDAGTGFPAPGTTHGWNAIELLAQDPDVLQQRLDGSAFEVIGPPRNLWPAADAPRAMQAIGPAGELLYFTRVIPSAFSIPMTPAATPVDRVFIMVVGGPSMAALRDFYGTTLGLDVGEAAPFPISTLSRALALPPETTYPLATASLPKDFLVELDEYPLPAVAREQRPGHLPAGVAMVSFAVEDLDAFDIDWRQPPTVIDEFPYNGQRSAITAGPAGEWIELIETHALPQAPPGIPIN